MSSGRRVDASPAVDPWAELAAAIVERAICDAQGRRMYGKSPEAREKTISDARHWLRNGAGGLTAELGIDDQALGDALGL